MLRILFTGENWYGSNARSCAESLRRLGHDVLDIDQQTFIPQVTMFTSRVVRRLLWFRLNEEFNRYVLSQAEAFQPDIFLAFKGGHLHPGSLKLLRRRGIPLYNYFPDTSAFAHGKRIPRSLPEYDCIFYTKPFWYSDTTKRIPLKAGYFLPHGYDPLLHRPVDLNQRDIADFGCDVSFIATYTAYKAGILEQLIRLRPGLDLRIWGNGWAALPDSSKLRACVKGTALVGEGYIRGIRSTRINLAIMSGQVAGSSSGDLTTSRTYIIPASGAFMLHQRNPEVLGLYDEGTEIACFESPEELADKIDYYLAHPGEREAIARAGYERCVPAYSYDNRMAELIRWHYDHAKVGELHSSSVQVGSS